MEHRKRNNNQHKVELSLILQTLMAGRRNRRVRSLVNNEGRIITEYSETQSRKVPLERREEAVY